MPVACRMLDRAALAENVLYVIGTPPAEYVVETKRASDARAGKIRPMRQDFDDNVRNVVHRFHDLMYGNILSSLNGDYNEQLSAQGGVRGGEHVSAAYRSDWVSYDVTKNLSASQLGRYVSGLISIVYFINKRVNDLVGFTKSGMWARPVSDQNSPLVFIGDKLNPAKRKALWPFVDNAASSLFLTEALHELRLPESHLMFMNVNDVGGKNLLNEVHERWPRARIITLGAKAYEGIFRLFDEEQIFTVDHPSYVKRFGGSKEFALNAYVKTLREIL